MLTGITWGKYKMIWGDQFVVWGYGVLSRHLGGIQFSVSSMFNSSQKSTSQLNLLNSLMLLAKLSDYNVHMSVQYWILAHGTSTCYPTKLCELHSMIQPETTLTIGYSTKIRTESFFMGSPQKLCFGLDPIKNLILCPVFLLTTLSWDIISVPKTPQDWICTYMVLVLRRNSLLLLFSSLKMSEI